jgi:hypothetical protein
MASSADKALQGTDKALQGTDEALQGAELLLRYAAEAGKDLSDDIVAPIIKARKNEDSTAPLEAEFWIALSKLSSTVRPVSVDSLSPQCKVIISNEKRNYSIWSVLLLIIIIPLSAATFSASTIIKDVISKVDEICKSETILNCKTSESLSIVPSAEPKDDELNNKILVEAATSMMYFRLRWLNRLSFYQIKMTDLDNIYGHGSYIGDFKAAIIVARDLKERTELVYGLLGSYVLPVAYAMLGAVAFGLRSLSDGVASRTLLPSSLVRSRMRFRLAILAGVVVGLFTDFTKGAALSPLAIAFLVGYAVEIFFSFLDSIIESMRKVKA